MELTREKRIEKQEGGLVLLADVPNAGVSTVDPNTKSGNARHDKRSGKFGAAPGKQRARGATVDHTAINQDEALQRYFDAVRDAAREFDDLDDVGVLKEFLEGRVQDISKVNLDEFMARVQAQRVTDVVDLLDATLKKAGGLIASRRTVKLSAPKGFIKRAFNGLSDDAVLSVLRRLESRSHDKDDVSGVLDKISDTTRRENLKSTYGGSE